MKGLPPPVMLPPSRLVKWGRWLQTILLLTVLLLLIQQLNLLPPPEDAPASAKEQRKTLKKPYLNQTVLSDYKVREELP